MAAHRSPLIVCCDSPLVWEFCEEAWFASCWRCRKDFVYSEPVSPVRQRGGRPRGAMG